MPSVEHESSIAVMVETCVVPTGWTMAVAALLSAAPVVRVVFGMA
jgi:hypothetical protein